MSENINIANIALSMVGANPINSLEDSSLQARLIKLHYPYCRDAVLEACDWSFARKRFIPAREAAGPLYGWNYSYPIPSDVLIVRRVERNYGDPRKNDLHDSNDNAVPHQMENRKIFTDEETIYCIGTRRVEEEATYSAMFVQALAARIAMAICMPVTESSTRLSAVTSLYGGYVNEAMSRDGQQSTGRRIRNTRMLQARRR